MTAGAPGRTVLLVEDSATYRELAQYLLESLGYTVIHAASAADALIRAREDQPDVILMDLNLPGASGLDAIRELRSDPRTRHIPALAVSAEAWSEGVEQKAKRAGFDAFATKPITREELQSELRRFRSP